MLGILHALGPAGQLKQKLLEDALKELRPGPKSQDNIDWIRGLAEKAAASICSYDEYGDYREGWEYLSGDAQSKRSSEEWLQKAREERIAIPRAVFLANGTGEVLMGGGRDLAVVEVFGVSSEYGAGGEVRETRGTVLVGLIYTEGKWLVQTVSWYPETVDKEEASAV